MIFLSADKGSLGATVGINALPSSTLKENEARVNSTPALDGGVVVVHAGVTPLDSAIIIRGNITRAIEEKLWELFYGFTSFVFVTGVKCYLATIKRLKTDAGQLIMELILISEEN